MRRMRLLKTMALLVVTAMLLVDLKPLENDGSWFTGTVSHVREMISEKISQAQKASAAEGDEPTYSFLMPSGKGSIPNGGTLNYSQINRSDRELSITLQSSLGIVSGTSVSWDVSNPNICEIASTSQNGVRVTLKIKSPGFAGLTVDVTEPNGTLHPAAAFCSVYVPLEWADAERDGNIMELSIPEKYHYGLLIAQNGETADSKTLQLYTKDSSKYKDCYHYIRKLKYVSYEFTDEAIAASRGSITGYVPSDVDPADLKEPQTALLWESSDPTVVSVNEKTGMIIAHAPGFARITVTSTTVEDQDAAKLSFNVVVVPESHAVGYTTDNVSKYTIRTDPDQEKIVIQLAKSEDEALALASSLNWQLFQGDSPDVSKDITKQYASYMDISTTSGRVVLEKLPAGVYYLTAIPVKDATASRLMPTYGSGSGGISAANIQYMGIVIIVPVSFPTKSIILNYYNDNVFDSFDLLANSNLPAGAFRFFSNDTEIAAVGVNDGIVEARGVGVCKISVGMTDSSVLEEIFGSYATSGSAINYDGSNMLVDVTVVNGISLNTTSETMSVGASLQLALTAPNPYQGDVVWLSSNEKVATVDENGLVTAVGAGDANITVRIKVGGVTKQARCRIKVISAVTGIVLTSKTDYVVVGENLTISATITPKVNGAELVWACSDPKLASIADTSPLSMTITGVKVGTIVVSALNPDNNMVATKVIKVVQEITGITLSDTEVTIAQTQKFYQLYAKVTPELPESETLNWTTSNKKVVTVDQNGKVTLVKPGSAVITVSSKNGKMAQCTFTVTQGVTSIAFDESDVVMYVGDKHKLTYQLKPENAYNTKVKWGSLNSKVATVDASGYVTAKNVGTAVITLQTTDGTGLFTTCTVTVYRNAKGLKLDVTSLSMNVGDVYNLEATLTPPDSSDVISYESSNTKVAMVSNLGKITAKGKGNCVIMAQTEAGLKAYVSVAVTQQVTGIVLSSSQMEIFVGDEAEIKATIEPKSASDNTVTWTSTKANVASVDDRGRIKGLAVGTTVIKCTANDGDVMSYCVVTVLERVTGITLPEEITIYIGDRVKLEAKIANTNASDQTLEWASADPNIVTVDERGNIKGIRLGTCYVTAKATDGSDVSAKCEVTVAPKVLTIKDELTMNIGEKTRMEPKVNNKSVNFEDVEWASLDESIVTVDYKGDLRGISVGTAFVTATLTDGSGVTAKCEVTVIPTEVTIEEQVSVGLGRKIRPEAKVGNAIATNKNAVWESSNEAIATVSEKGYVKGEGIGTCTITIRPLDGSDSYAECDVTVFSATTSIDIDPSMTYIELLVGESKTVSFSTDPPDSSYNPKWESSDTSIAVVNQKGTITGLKAGTTTIIASAPDDPEITGTVVVKVSNPVYASSVTFDNSELVMTSGETKGIIATFSPSNITEGYTWSSDNPSVAVVDSTGKITARNVGTAIITLMTQSGKKGTVTVYVVGLSETNVTLYQYEKLLLNLEIDGGTKNKLTIRWGTSNQEIAEMKNGQVTAKARGTTTVYAMVNGRKLECKIKVISNLR